MDDVVDGLEATLELIPLDDDDLKEVNGGDGPGLPPLIIPDPGLGL